MTPLSLVDRSPRSPRIQVAGLLFTARVIDKLRASLPGGELNGYLALSGFSEIWSRYTGVDLTELRAVVENAGSEREVEVWLFEHTIDLDRARVNGTLERANTARTPESMRERFETIYPAELRAEHPLLFDLLDADDARLYAGRDGGATEMSPLLAAVLAADIDRVRHLLAKGVNPRLGNGRELPLHVAARRGPLELVEILIAGGALPWQRDAEGRTALDSASLGRGPDRAAIVTLLDRTAIVDPPFREAVGAIHAGDAATLARVLERNPDLLQRRNMGPDAFRNATRHDYFRDPKLFWYVANNPTLIERLPRTIGDVARVMIERGIEQTDLDYALTLLMSGGDVGRDGPARSLMILLLDAGAVVSEETILVTAGHWQREALRVLLERGYPASPLIAAALGDVASLRGLLANAKPTQLQDAFGLAIINRQLDAATVALDAGADVNASLPVHSHSTALHQAAAFDSAELVAFLVARGARLDTRDTLWDGTPLDWARHGDHERARVALENAAGIT